MPEQPLEQQPMDLEAKLIEKAMAEWYEVKMGCHAA